MKISNIKQTVKNLYVRIKFYRWGEKRQEGNQLFFFVQEGYPQSHPGLVDRFKAIIGLYYIAKCNDFDFQLVYDTPFSLDKYLQPAVYDWNKKYPVSRNPKDVKLIEYGGFKTIPRLSNEIPQYHCYYYEGLNVLKMAQIDDWTGLWGELYRELFKPSAYLQELIDKYVPNKEYIAVHIRFVNALEQFEKGYESHLSKEQQQKLIDTALAKIQEIRNKEQKEVYVFSDSARFLTEAKKNGCQMLPIENIGHISFQSDSSVHDKTFVDFYAMAMSDKVYSIQGEYTYSSVFSQFAAIIGETEYEIVKI